MKLKLTQTQLVLSVSLFFAIFYNFTFFKKTLIVYPLDSGNSLFIISLFLVLVCAINLILNIFRVKIILKSILIALFFLATLASYSMDSFNVVIDEGMLSNTLNSSIYETNDLITIKLMITIVGLLLERKWW